MKVKFLLMLFGFCLAHHFLIADFFAKIPEFNPGDGSGGYNIFQPPWYPYNLEESENYTVDESGKVIKRPSNEDDSLRNYGKKKKTKSEIIKYEMKKVSEKLIFEKVIKSPDVVVWDFYTHVDFMGFDLSYNSMPIQGGGGKSSIFRSGVALEFGGYPPIPGDKRVLYDTWVMGVIFGWNYDSTGKNSGGPANLFGFGGSDTGKVWKGLLVPNLREFSVFLSTEGVATAKHAALLVSRDKEKRFFNPGLAALKAFSGKDFGFNSGKWTTQYIQPLYQDNQKPTQEDYKTWEACIESFVMRDLTEKRVPAADAFWKLRDVPELSEPLFLKLLEVEDVRPLIKRNLASLLGGFASPRAAQALHKLVRDQDTVTALRAADSLARHPHGKLKQVLIDWLDPEKDDVRRAKSILMIGRAGNSELAQKLIEFFPKAQDEMERELVLRSLMRLRAPGAEKLFAQKEKSKFETLRYTCQLGKLVLGALSEGQVLQLIKDAFYREDAIPGSGKIISFSPKFRTDLIKWMAHTDHKEARRKLWRYIHQYKDMGGASELAGVPHILSYGLYEIKLGDDVISQQEAIKVLHRLTTTSSTDIQIKIAALSRLYELDASKCLKACHKIIERFLKGRQVSELSGNAFAPSERDLLVTAINLVFIDDPNQVNLVERLLAHPNIDPEGKSRTLENLYHIKKKKVLSIVEQGLKFYTSKVSLTVQEKRYLVRLMRFAGELRDKRVAKEIVKIMRGNPDPWLRFIALYALRLACQSEDYVNVITGKSQEREKLARNFLKKINKFK